jgi:hypothetical protein
MCAVVCGDVWIIDWVSGDTVSSVVDQQNRFQMKEF